MKIYHNEWDKNACSVLRKHFPDSFVDERSIADVKVDEIKNYKQCHFFAGIGGFSAAFERYAPNVNVWTGGFPCQDLSIAGKREGLAGSRSGFYFAFHELIISGLPGWVVLENVPGLLSSNGGKDFAVVVGGLTGIVPEVPKTGWGNAGFFRGSVYQVAYRVLDAQYFGVPQRRRRVFIVGSLGDGRAAEVLFESEGSSGDTPPSRKAGKDVAYSLRANPSHSGDKGDGGINTTMVANTLSTSLGHHGWSVGDQDINNLVPSIVSNGDAHSGFRDEKGLVNIWEPRSQDGTPRFHYDGISPTLNTAKGGQRQPMVGVRRLTPTECERLQGFPDGFTDGQSDSARYRQLGNAVAVPVVEWIARRIMKANRSK